MLRPTALQPVKAPGPVCQQTAKSGEYLHFINSTDLGVVDIIIYYCLSIMSDYDCFVNMRCCVGRASLVD